MTRITQQSLDKLKKAVRTAQEVFGDEAEAWVQETYDKLCAELSSGKYKAAVKQIFDELHTTLLDPLKGTEGSESIASVMKDGSTGTLSG